MSVSKQKIKVMHLVGGLGLGGIERLVTDMCRVLTKKGGYELSVCCVLERAGPFLKDILELGVPVYECLISRRGILSFSGKFKRLLQDVRPDVLHSHLHWAVPWQIIAVRWARVPSMIITRHRIAARRGVTMLRQKSYAILMRRSVDRFTAVSEAVRANIVQHRWAKLEEIAVVPNGVNVAAFGSDCIEKNSAKQRIRLNGIPVVGTVGNLRLDKGHKYLVEAARLIVDAGVDCHFVLVGDGGLREPLEKQVERLELTDRFAFLGRRRDIPEVLRAMDVFVLPSLWEGQGIALVEAMAAGLPCIGTAVGGIPEVLDAGRAGILVPSKDPKALADAIVQLLSDSELASRLSKAARERAKAFSIEACAAKYEELYGRLLAKNGRYPTK